MDEKVVLVRAVQTAIACPSQWDAWDAEGNYYYLRYRSGHGSIARFADENWVEAEEPVERKLIADFEFGHPLDGSIGLEKFAELAGIELAPNLMTTGFGDHMAHQLVMEGIPLELAEAVTEPWRKLDPDDEGGDAS